MNKILTNLMWNAFYYFVPRELLNVKQVIQLKIKILGNFEGVNIQ
jgi:hypothetical protein